MSNKAVFTAAWLLTAVTLLIGLYYYPQLPDTMIGHWDASGRADGTMSRFWGVVMLPLVMLAITTIFWVIPRADPLKANIHAFRPQYNIFLLLLLVLFAAVQVAVLAINLGARFNIVVAIMPAVGALFFYVGMLLPRTKRNWAVGIRTPWTMSSDAVWHKTHKLGGVVFKVLGVLAILTVLAPAYALTAFFVPLVISLLGVLIYSYVVHLEEAAR